MFIANDQAGQFFSLIGKTREQIVAIRNQPFFCPICKQKLQIKAGVINVPHFSHVHLSHCPTEWEPESEQHLEGKLLLRELFLKLGWQVELEAFLKAISQKPDLLVQKENQKVAIEYQCSPSTIEKLQKRMKGYQKLGVKQRWIFGPELLKLASSSMVQLSETVFSSFDRQFQAWGLDVANQELIHFHRIFPFSPRRIFSLHAHYPIASTLNLQCKSPPINILNHWKMARLKWSVTPNISKLKRDVLFDRFLYIQNAHKSLLPPFIGIPLPSLPYLKTSAPVWQAYIFFDLYQLLQTQTLVKKTQLFEMMQSRVKKGEIELRDFILTSSSLMKPVQEYVQFLVAIHVFQDKENNIIRGQGMDEIKFSQITQDRAIQNLHYFYNKQRVILQSFLER